jgi:hypothetical protein
MIVWDDHNKRRKLFVVFRFQADSITILKNGHFRRSIVEKLLFLIHIPVEKLHSEHWGIVTLR